MNSGSTPPTARLTPFTVGEWLVEPRACRISRGATVEKVRPQLLDLLVCLARRPGEIVLKADILAEVWPGQFIADSGLSRCIAELRQLLQDDAQRPRYIEATRKRGYRVIAPVEWLPPDSGSGPAGEGREPAPPAPEETEHLRAEPAVVTMAAAVAPRPRLLTRARVGLVLVVAVIAAVVLVMMTRSPANVLTEQDTVLLAFENRTGDRVFDESIPLAMSIQLGQSPHLGLLSRGRIQETLRMMQRPADTPLTRAIAMEVCERVGGRAVIVTSIASLGRQYVIGIEAVTCGTNEEVLTRRQVTADGKEQVLAALQGAAVEIRSAVGESDASLERYGVPIAQATTASLDALRALSRGDVARERGEASVALGSYREAVSLDPDFALAHLRRGTFALAGGGTEAERREALEKAYALRERVTLPERMEIEAWYHYLVTGEHTRVIVALELLKRTYPRRALFRRSLSDAYMFAGRHDAAVVEALEAQRLEPNSVMTLVALGRAYLYSNRIADARATADKAIGLGGTVPALHYILFQAGLAADDRDLLARERTWAAEHPDLAVPWIIESEAEESMSRGRLTESLELMRRYESEEAAGGRPVTAAVLRLRMGRYEALLGLRARALRRINEEIRRGLPPEIKIDAVKVAISAGAFDLAARLLDEIERTGASGGQPDATFIPAYRAAIEASHGRIDQALARLTPLEPFDLGTGFGFIPLFERAQAHYLAANWTMARAGFEKILAHPTIDSGKKLLPLAQIGLARTLARTGDVAGSRRTYETFFERWKNADPGLPLFEQARREYEALPK